MKLKAQLAGTDHDVSIDFNHAVGERASAEVDGRQYEIEVRELTSGQYLLLVDGRVCKARVESQSGSRAPGLFAVTASGQSYDIEVVDPKRLRTGENTAAYSTGSAQIISPMPGKVVRILVEPGAPIEVGAGVLVVEAMKMQNEMKSPKAGIVTSINAEVGATVSAGDVLAVIE
jgi:biotin carboxyl carrier protein